MTMSTYERAQSGDDAATTVIEVGGGRHITDLEGFVQASVKRLGATLLHLLKSRDYHMDFVTSRNDDIAQVERVLAGMGVDVDDVEFTAPLTDDPTDELPLDETETIDPNTEDPVVV